LLGFHSGSGSEHDTELERCSTCLGAITQACVLWPCGHIFNVQCVLDWFQTIRDFPDIDNFDEMPSVYQCSICRTFTDRICHTFTGDGHLEHMPLFKNIPTIRKAPLQNAAQAMRFSKALIRYRTARERLQKLYEQNATNVINDGSDLENEQRAAVAQVRTTSPCLNPPRPRLDSNGSPDPPPMDVLLGLW
jgi:hypothetical protein